MKDNQEGLRKQVEHGCNNQKATGIYEEEVEGEHGRIDIRKYEVFDSYPMLKNWKEWKAIRKVIRVTRYRERKGKDPTNTVHYYVSNNKEGIPPEKMGEYIRKHWYIENVLHHVKDTAFLEDKCTKIINPFIYSTCIDMALNEMRAAESTNIRGDLYKNSMNLERSIRLLGYSFGI